MNLQSHMVARDEDDIVGSVTRLLMVTDRFRRLQLVTMHGLTTYSPQCDTAPANLAQAGKYFSVHSQPEEGPDASCARQPPTRRRLDRVLGPRDWRCERTL